MKLYKVLDKNCNAKDGGDFDYTPYLCKGNKKGKWTPKIDNIKLCSKGYHVTPYWNMYVNSETNRVFEVEVKGLIERDDVGVIDKYVCNQIRFIKEITQKLGYYNTGDCNTGDYNTGDCNTGYSNTGYKNTGDCNTGNYNTGYFNTGYKNTGYSNTGYYNTGDRNTGYYNTGDKNTGYSNTGDRNTGNSNTGDYNTGDKNTGDCNTGDYNTGDKNTGYYNTGNCNTGHRNTGYYNTGCWNNSSFNCGFFNSKEVKYINVFNKKCLKSVWDNAKKPNFIYFILKNDYKESFIKSFENTTKYDLKLLLQLPNFDYDVFEEISGITKEMIQNKLKGE